MNNNKLSCQNTKSHHFVGVYLFILLDFSFAMLNLCYKTENIAFLLFFSCICQKYTLSLQCDFFIVLDLRLTKKIGRLP